MLQLRQQVLMLMTEMMARLQKLTDIVYLQQQLLLSAHCVLSALHKQGPFDVNKASWWSCALGQHLHLQNLQNNDVILANTFQITCCLRVRCG